MALGNIYRDGRIYERFIYEGEDLYIEYPDGSTLDIAPDRVHVALLPALRPDGEPCHIVPELTPVTRLPIKVKQPLKADTNDS